MAPRNTATTNIVFSIVIPTFNSIETICRCLDSVNTQIFKNYEVWIIDGNSTDGTIGIIKKYSENHDRINYISEPDRGTYDAMNKGIGIAKGEWLYFLGSDDEIFGPAVLENINNFIKTDSKTKLIYGNVKTSNNQVERYEDFTFRKLIKLNICQQCILYHNSLFNTKRFNLKYKICADWDFNLSVFKKINQPSYFDEIISLYSLNGISNDWRSHPDYLNYFKDLKNVIRYRGIPYFCYLFGLEKATSLVRKVKAFKI